MLHYMIDAYDSCEANLNDLMSVYESLITVSNELNLKTVMPPSLVPYYYSNDYRDNGISAFV